MSMPSKTISCTQCDFKINSMSVCGAHYYLTPKEEEVFINSRTGWCFHCKSIRNIESVAKMGEIEQSIIKLSKEVLPHIKHVIQWLRDWQYRENFQELSKLHTQLEILKQREGKEVCLNCGKAQFQLFSAKQVAALFKDEQYEVAHPGCKNSGLLVNEDFLRLNMGFSPIYHDLNGQIIEDS